MRVLLNVNGMSQYSAEVRPEYQSSACGPTTAHVILNYLSQDEAIINKDVNEWYKTLGGTKIGLFKWRMIKNLRNALGPNWTIDSCSLTEAIEQLRIGNPVAMKFDNYFTLQFLSKIKPLFKYHWVPLIGYEIKDDELHLIIHDNGGRNRESQLRTFRYEDNRRVLSFVKIEPKF
ncbi:C39 family peptidase [Solibacillus sp. FSL H8-0538]|uniref:C39 family peptidase n=1 Tax=Solibacillus sp. FSL H8-0538 TaxID=2921400 RepID=UPI0030F75109